MRLEFLSFFDLQINPVNPGMQLHKIEKSKDKYFAIIATGAISV